MFDIGWILNKAGCSMLSPADLSRPAVEVGAKLIYGNDIHKINGSQVNHMLITMHTLTDYMSTFYTILVNFNEYQDLNHFISFDGFAKH